MRLFWLVFLAACAGSSGSNGINGERGPQGEPGPQGDPGAPGMDGASRWHLVDADGVEVAPDDRPLVVSDGAPFLIDKGDAQLVKLVAATYYSNDDCTGTAYVEPREVDDILVAFQIADDEWVYCRGTNALALVATESSKYGDEDCIPGSDNSDLVTISACMTVSPPDVSALVAPLWVSPK